VINEIHTREAGGGTYASLVTLRSYDTAEGERKGSEQIIEGYVSGRSVFISKLDRFTASFNPEGTLLILHNYDEPGKIGGVGMVLGRKGVNIEWMQVASLDKGLAEQVDDLPLSRVDSAIAAVEVTGNEALMILGVGGPVGKEVVEDLKKEEGILDVSLIRL
jgi:D-3-phosphoglycerate dehydrogenase